MNKRGQALVEFVLIVPVILIIIFSIFDFCNIYYQKMKLENITTDIIEIMEDKDNYDEVDNLIKKRYGDISYQVKYTESNYIEMKLSKKIKLITPGLNLVLSNPYKIEVTRYIEYETDEQ